MKLSQALIILLLIANIFATVWFGINHPVSDESNQLEKASQHELPKFITSDVIDGLYNRFSKAFNSRDYKTMYDMFGPAAKAQFSAVDAKEEFDRLIQFFDYLESGAYTYSELIKSQGSRNVYILHYWVEFSEKSQIGKKGDLKITIAIQGDDFQIYGIRINADSK